MDLDDLRTLVTIVEQGSFSAAARARGVSQPSVTKQVQRIEAELGVPLLVRGPKHPAETTAAGERAVDFARQTLAHFDALRRALAELKAVDEGTLLLAASTIPGEYLVPGLLSAFRAEYPQIRVEVTVSDTADVVDRVLSDEADLGLIGSPLRVPGLCLERLAGDEIVLVVPPEHPFARRRLVSVQELADQPLILREKGSGTRRSVEFALATAGAEPEQLQAALILGSTQAVLQAVQHGLGLGFVSARAAARDEADGHVACVRLDGIDLHRGLYMAYLSSRIGEPLLAHFLSFAHSRFRAED